MNFLFRKKNIKKNFHLSLATVYAILICLFLLPQKSFAGNDVKDSKNKSENVPGVLETQQAATYKLKGVVVDEAGEPVIGVPVVVVGTTLGTVTNIDGEFTLDVKKGQVIEVKSMGFKAVQVHVTGQNNVKITLEEDIAMLDEAVVVGFGTQKKVSVVGSVQSITGEELRVPSTQLSTSFAGRLPGVIAVQRSGQPGADGADFWIRGISTFGGRKEPLIIVDGVQMSAGDLNNIDPDIIENFSILKDATATALYGTLGANGVMIVTTKSGKDIDKPIVRIRIESAISSPIKVPKFVGGVQYMEMFNEAQNNPSSASYIPYTQLKIDKTREGVDIYGYPDVDWYKEMFKNTQFAQKASINITGGTKRVDYFSSINASYETGMLKNRSKEFTSYSNNIRLTKANFQNNVNLYPTPTTTMSLRLNVQIGDKTSPYRSTGDLFGYTIKINPVDYPILYPSTDDRITNFTDEYTMWGGKVDTNVPMLNPLAELISGYNTGFTSMINVNAEVVQKLDFLTKGLSAKALYSFKNYSSTSVSRASNYNQFYITEPVMSPEGNYLEYTLRSKGGNPGDEVLNLKSSGGSGDRRMYLQALVNYERTFAALHDVGAMLLYNQDEINYNSPSGIQQSLPLRKQGMAGRFSYSYDYRYLAEMNFGYNGSENFAKGHRFGFFPSFAVGWVVASEEFFKPLKNTISHMKIRGSWGKVGNDQGSTRFMYMPDLALTGGASYTTGVDQNITYAGPTYKRFGNKDLTWEVGEKINLGIDLQFFKSLNLVFEIFQERRKNIFMQRQTIPNFMGTTGTDVFGNLGKVDNKGFEFSGDYNKSFSKDLIVSFRGSFTYAANKVKEYDEPMFMLYPNISRVGHSVNQQLLYLAQGLFVDAADIANSPTQMIGGFVSPGDIKYKELPDRYGEYHGTIDSNSRQYTGRPTVPEIVYGFGPSVRFKEWDMSMFFQGAGRTSLVMSGFHPFGDDYQRNILKFVAKDYWSETNQNPNAAYPRLSIASNTNNTVASTFWQRDASFLKLKSMEIGYNFPLGRVYATGNNLLTFSKFKHWDPEMGGGAGLSYPTMRTFSIGLSLFFK